MYYAIYICVPNIGYDKCNPLGYYTARFIKPYRDPVQKRTGFQLGFMKWALHPERAVLYLNVFWKYLLRP